MQEVSKSLFLMRIKCVVSGLLFIQMFLFLTFNVYYRYNSFCRAN